MCHLTSSSLFTHLDVRSTRLPPVRPHSHPHTPLQRTPRAPDPHRTSPHRGPSVEPPRVLVAPTLVIMPILAIDGQRRSRPGTPDLP